MNDEGLDDLARLIVKFDDDIFSEISQRSLGSGRRAEKQDLIRPFLEFGVVSEAALENDGFVNGQAGRLAAGAGIAAFPMDHHFGGSAETADARDAGDVPTVPLYAKLERLIRIEAARIDRELWHGCQDNTRKRVETILDTARTSARYKAAQRQPRSEVVGGTGQGGLLTCPTRQRSCNQS